jgi:hypothetical protein
MLDMKMLINYKDILNLHEMFGIFEKCHLYIGPRAVSSRMLHIGSDRSLFHDETRRFEEYSRLA